MPRWPPAYLPGYAPTESTPPRPGRKAVLVSNNQFFVLDASLFPNQKLGSAVAVFCEACCKFDIGRYQALLINFKPYYLLNALISVNGIDIPDERVVCDFRLPIVRRAFFTQCVPQNNIQPLVAAVKLLLQLPACPGNTMWEGEDIWTSTGIPDCTICRHCWETYLRPSSFAQYFHHKLHLEEQHWCCDIGKDPGYVHDVLVQSLQSPHPDFLEFARAVNERLLMTPCPGEGNPIHKSQDGLVHTYSHPGARVAFCSECYHDQIALTPFSSSFINETHDGVRLTVYNTTEFPQRPSK